MHIWLVPAQPVSSCFLLCWTIGTSYVYRISRFNWSLHVQEIIKIIMLSLCMLHHWRSCTHNMIGFNWYSVSLLQFHLTFSVMYAFRLTWCNLAQWGNTLLFVLFCCCSTSTPSIVWWTLRCFIYHPGYIADLDFNLKINISIIPFAYV